MWDRRHGLSQCWPLRGKIVSVLNIDWMMGWNRQMNQRGLCFQGNIFIQTLLPGLGFDLYYKCYNVINIGLWAVQFALWLSKSPFLCMKGIWGIHYSEGNILHLILKICRNLASLLVVLIQIWKLPHCLDIMLNWTSEPLINEERLKAINKIIV